MNQLAAGSLPLRPASLTPCRGDHGFWAGCPSRFGGCGVGPLGVGRGKEDQLKLRTTCKPARGGNSCGKQGPPPVWAGWAAREKRCLTRKE